MVGPGRATLSLQLAEFGLGEQAKITDALSGEVLPHDSCNLKPDIASWRYRVLRVPPQ